MNAPETLTQLAAKLSTCESDCLRLAERGGVKRWEAVALMQHVAMANALAIKFHEEVKTALAEQEGK